MSERAYRPDDPTNPTHYRADGGRECIDVMREAMGDEAFVAFCLGNAFKYMHRKGLKGCEATDRAKARWYVQMAAHVGEARLRLPDPRDHAIDSMRVLCELLTAAVPTWWTRECWELLG